MGLPSDFARKGLLSLRGGDVRGLAGEIGTIARFRCEASLALYLGMATLDNSSAKVRRWALNGHEPPKKADVPGVGSAEFLTETLSGRRQGTSRPRAGRQRAAFHGESPGAPHLRRPRA